MKKTNEFDLNTIILRGHHLFCVPLFAGAGYSEQFIDNMKMIVNSVKSGNIRLAIVTGSDDICSCCPNLTEDGSCLSDSTFPKGSASPDCTVTKSSASPDCTITKSSASPDCTITKNSASPDCTVTIGSDSPDFTDFPKEKKQIQDIDSCICDFFDIKENLSYSPGELFEKILASVTAEFFESVCGSCRWFKAGFCNYESYTKALKALLTFHIEPRDF
ncbi:MAG: DUF1284 domain-containing protein [Lachnospiraceae bacterium]|jgi:hypothetical protein